MEEGRENEGGSARLRLQEWAESAGPLVLGDVLAPRRPCETASALREAIGDGAVGRLLDAADAVLGKSRRWSRCHCKIILTELLISTDIATRGNKTLQRTPHERLASSDIVVYIASNKRTARGAAERQAVTLPVRDLSPQTAQPGLGASYLYFRPPDSSPRYRADISAFATA